MIIGQFELDIIAQKYNDGLSCDDIAKQHFISIYKVKTIIKNLGIWKRKPHIYNTYLYTLNKNYFDVIDTQEKAYFLGLLYADGCNCVVGGYRISIKLQEQDKPILDKLNVALGSNRPLGFRELSKKNPKWKNAYELQIGNKHLSKQLEILGCMPNKSLTLIFPTEQQVPKHLINHFVRGVWDGDGSISCSNKKNILSCNLVSTQQFCEKLSELLYKELSIYSSIYQDKKSKLRNTSTRRFTIRGGHKNVKIFLDWLYKDATVYLERKYKLYLPTLQIQNCVSSQPI